MNLTDKEVLELNGLCNALVDGTLSTAQRNRLSHWLATSEEARRYYVQAMGLSASLFSYASEMQTEEPEPVAPPAKLIHTGWWWFGSLAAAASVVLILWLEWPKRDTEFVKSATHNKEFVATLTGSKECRWANAASSVQPGSRLCKGQRIELAAGFAEITFDSGAQVILNGPASLDANSAWSATLNRGTLKASVPPEAIGFSISNPTVEVVDLGTEFTMFADASRTATEVFVLKGEVEAAPNTLASQQPIVLREKESRRFAASGISNVPDSAQKFALFAQPLLLDHFASPTGYIHWSFDEINGQILKGDAFGLPLGAYDAQLENLSPAELVLVHPESRWHHALKFDGHLFVKATFPNISKDSPHTVVFWVKVPKDASLSSAYAMVAWGKQGKRFGTHPIHICWNRNPDEGPVGALRTDYGGGFAMGTTSLRDGRWHHIAVVVMAGKDATQAMEVKQYVDGRFEGEGNPSPPGSDIFTKFSDENVPTTSNTVWLGCRLGIHSVRQNRFRGEMDELYIADRTLEPQEIVQLMKDNQMSQPQIATAKK